jgi:hypothetical protein
METPRPESWYAPTAYTARKKKEFSPPNPAAWKGPARTLRAHPLPIGVHCGDFRTDINIKDVEAFKNGTVEPVPNHEYTEMGCIANPKTLFTTLQRLAGIFSAIGLFALWGNVSIPPKTREEAFCYLFFFAPFILFIIFSICRKLAPHKNNIVFNRRTGMVTVPSFKKEVPFAELDAYYYCPQSTVGYRHTLYFGHRYSSFGFGSPASWVDKQWLHGEWEYYQQYMDIDLPLPDLPDFEPYRHLDPTTASYDKKHNRPPDYWRDMPMEQVIQEKKAGHAAMRDFPWHKLPPADHIPKECMDRLLPGARLFK